MYHTDRTAQDMEWVKETGRLGFVVVSNSRRALQKESSSKPENVTLNDDISPSCVVLISIPDKKNKENRFSSQSNHLKEWQEPNIFGRQDWRGQYYGGKDCWAKVSWLAVGDHRRRRALRNWKSFRLRTIAKKIFNGLSWYVISMLRWSSWENPSTSIRHLT